MQNEAPQHKRQGIFSQPSTGVESLRSETTLRSRRGITPGVFAKGDRKNIPAKDTFRLILVLMVVILVVLPFATTFNEFLTRMVEGTGAYRLIQNIFVPYLSHIVVGILRLLPGLRVAPYQFGVVVNGVDVRITWNCLGWQGYLLFFTSLIFGLRGNFKSPSKFEAVIIGFLGTFLVNIFRLVFTAALVGWSPELFVILFHNYFMTFVSIIWLLFFWWFSYSYVLVEKEIAGSINK